MANELDLSLMENCVCFNLRRVARAVTQFFDAELRRHGIRPTQTPILALLSAKSELGMAELSDWLGMERTTLVRNLRPLQREGLITLRGTGSGNRVSVSITAQGKAVLAKIMPDWRATQRAVVKSLGEERWAAILSDLERAASILSK